MAEHIFNLAAIRAALDAEEWEQDEYEHERLRRSVYLGSVFNLVPSGKYYTPYACSNVSDEEAALDEEWFEQAERELASIDCYLESGEGDPTDLFVGESRYVEEN